MSTFLSVYLRGASMILLLTVSRAQDYNFTPPPDYDSDYNATFDYSFYSNSSNEELEKFSERFVGQDEDDDTGGWPEEDGGTVTMTTTQRPTERSETNGSNASLPVSLDIWMLVWTLMILISLNLQQLQHTL